MSILEKILPPKNTIFFDKFEDAANVCNKIAILLNDIVVNGLTDDKIIEARTLKHRGSNLERETISLLNSTFVTPIDREDIQLLASMLRKISKKIGQAMLTMNVYKLEHCTEELKQQADTILKATKELIKIVGMLKTLSRTKEITESREAMKEIETLGDEVHYRALNKLFSGEFDSLEVIKLRDIYKILESAMDKCNAVSDVILNIALKNS
ncbi:DUF47 family protein [bacterium]|nr:DUF47 family protein [bacterium]